MNELQSLSEIFQNRLFRIPDYQRGYAWQDSQLKDFWNDLINLQTNKYHYTGLLSLKKINDTDSVDNDDKWLLRKGYSIYHIVDGQQRLTTFIILLNELLNFVKDCNENIGKNDSEIYICYDLLKDIRSKYIFQKMPPENFITTYLFGYENDNPSAEYLKYEILGSRFSGTLKETYYTKNLKYAKDFFYKVISDYYEKFGVEKIGDLYTKLTQKLMFNIHEIKDDYDVFVAFETMNNRGKKLTNLEILKNRLIYLTTLFSKEIFDEEKAYELRKRINDTWKEVYFQLGRNPYKSLQDDEFLRAHWIIYFKYSRQKGDDYISFLLNKFSNKYIFDENLDYEKNEIDVSKLEDDEYDDVEEEDDEQIEEKLKPEHIFDYIDSLNENAAAWYYSFFPQESPNLSEREKLWLDRLNRVGISYFRPLITVVIRMNVSEFERVELFKAIERFIFISFRMARYQSSYKSSDFYRKTKQISDGKLSISEVTDDINEITNSNINDSVRSFLNKIDVYFKNYDGFYSWSDLKYFLFEYEYSLAEKRDLYKLDWGLLSTVIKGKISIEHILPQTPTKLYWKNTFRQFDEKEKKILASSLGNLLPLSQKINSSLQNDSFKDKKERGYHNGCHSELEVAKNQDWTCDSIYDRGMKLLSFMEERWGIKFENNEQKEDLLHISFIHDGKHNQNDVPEVSLEKPIEIIDEKSSKSDLYKAYWAYSLPIIQKENEVEGYSPYSKRNPVKSSYLDGYFGLGAMHLFSSVLLKDKKVKVGLWIDAGDKNSSKKIFDYLYSQKLEIEEKLGFSLCWYRRDEYKTCSIEYVESFDIYDLSQWEKIASFHASKTRALAEVIVYPRYKKIQELTR